jgi:hypothetical protein
MNYGAAGPKSTGRGFGPEAETPEDSDDNDTRESGAGINLSQSHRSAASGAAAAAEPSADVAAPAATAAAGPEAAAVGPCSGPADYPERRQLLL